MPPTATMRTQAMLDAESIAAERVWAATVDAVAAIATDADRGVLATTLSGLDVSAKAASYLAWLDYTRLAELADAATEEEGKGYEPLDDTRVFTAVTQAAAMVAMSRSISQAEAEGWVSYALILRDRLPQVALCLRDGLISATEARSIIRRTELLEDTEFAELVDIDIAALLRRRTGGWTPARLRSMVDRIIHRYDPDLIRRRRERSLANRRTWLSAENDGMANIGGSMSYENARLALKAVNRLAATACRRDTRSQGARTSDAMYALLTGEAFTCECGEDDCDAQIPEPATYPDSGPGQTVVHVVVDESTANGTADHPAFLDGYGVISATQARNIMDKPDTAIHPLGLDGKSLPTHLASDPYRPSTALDIFIRIRDGYCSVPGCDRPAFTAEVDHIAEYDHANPAAGGRTAPENCGAKCPFHHMLKTFGILVDDQFVDADGHIRTVWMGPGGVTFPGPAENNQDLFPGLNRIRFHSPDRSGRPKRKRTSGTNRAEPHRGKSRLKSKHERRQAERARNRRERQEHSGPAADDPPPF